MQDQSLEYLRRLDELLSTVLDLPPNKRQEFLDVDCEEDTALRQEVLLLLESRDDVDSILDAFSGHFDTLVDPTIPNGRFSSSEKRRSKDPFELVGKTVSNFHILEVIGGGGMGIVYKGKDLQLDRFVALKFLSPKLLQDPTTRERFVHEAKAASILDHPNIGIIHEIGETKEGQLFIAMTFYEGETLKAKLSQGLLPIETVLRYILEISEGLEFSHKRGVVHRDIKPSNIIITEDDKVKIVDFGLATFIDRPLENDTGRIMGTVGYMPPEQLRGEKTDFRADIWSTGIVLHELLYGRKPDRSSNGSIAFEESVSRSGSSSSGSAIFSHLNSITEKALRSDPNDRFPSMTVFLRELRQLLPGPFPATSFLQIAKKTILTRPISTAIVICSLILMGFFMSKLDPLNQSYAAESHSIGIEWLKNYTAIEDENFLSRGVTQELIHELTRFEALKVVSLVQANERQPASQNLAEDLNLKWKVSGNVYRKDGKIHISVTVQEVNSQRIISATPHVDDEEDLQILIHDVALHIIDKLNIPLSLSDEKFIENKSSVNPKAFELYLRGRFHVEMETPDHLEQAIKLFNEAITLEPSFSRAYASKVVPYYLLGDKYERYHPEAAFALARGAATMAIALDEMLPEAHVAQGVVRELIENDFDGAARSFLRAIELNPKDSEAHREYGLLLLRQGNIEKGLNQLNISLELLPTSMQIRRDVGRAYYYNKEYDKAIDQLTELLTMQPDFVRAHKILAFTYLLSGQIPEAKEAFHKAIQLDKSENEVDNKSFFAEADALSGNIEQAREKLDELIDYVNTTDKKGATSIALVYITLDEHDEAMKWAQRAATEEDLPPSILVDPRWDPLRSREDFQELISKTVH
ncbi:MAG: protein kinase [Rhodothermales bacterium]